MAKSGAGEGEPLRDETAAPMLPYDDGIAAELRDVFSHLRRRRRWIAVAAVIGAVAGLGVSLALPRLYTSTAQILVDPRGLRVFDNEVVPGGQISDVQSALIESEVRVLQSDSVLARVVDDQHLAEDPEFNGQPRNLVETLAAAVRTRLLGSQPPDSRAIALDELGKAVKVERVPNSFVLNLSVATRVAGKSATLAHAITDAFVERATSGRESTARKVSDELAQRLDTLGGEVQRAETAVDDFKRQNNIVDANGRPVNEQELGDLTNQLTAARVRTDELRSRYEQIARIQKSGAVPDATSETVQSSAITALRNRYAEAKQQRDNLLATLGPRHPALQAATAAMDGVRILIRAEIGRIAASTRNDFERAQQTQAGLEKQVQTITTTTGTVNTAAIRLRELEREAAARRAVYESFLTRSRETREQGDLPTVNISVISPAAVPLKAGGLPMALMVLIAAAFGASAGALAVLGVDHLVGRILTARQMTLATGLPLLGVVRRGRRRALALLRRRPVGRLAGTPAASSIRSLFRAILDAAPGQPPRIVLLLSVSRAVTRIELPLDLGEAAAEEDNKVLLVDAQDDRLTRRFDNGRGADRRSWTPVQRTPIPNLSVLSWSAPFIGATGGDGRGGADAIRHFSREHDVIFVHALLGDEQLRLRPLALVATTIVLLADADGLSLGDVDLLRQEIGNEASKVVGFAWVTQRDASRGRTPARDKDDAALETSAVQRSVSRTNAA